MVLTARQRVELFHLVFLRQLAAEGDRTLITLKGGCNLRFFFRSIRFSEDLDLDVSVMARGTLKNKVDRLLDTPALALPLRAAGLEVVDVSAPKQTDTTQRWKLGLRVDGQSVPVRTKVEFSRRERPSAPGTVAVGAVDRAVVDPLGIPPPLVQHYSAATAIEQKVAALAGRPETQARDVFDLHLLRTHAAQLKRPSADTRAALPKALERAVSLSYDDYVGQVVAYLDPQQARAFEGRAAWDALQLDVVDLLEALSR